MRVAERFSFPSFACASEEMCDCFHHLPCPDLTLVLERLLTFWSERGVSRVSVPRSSGLGPDRLGTYDLPGWLNVELSDMSCTFCHFTETNFVEVRGMVGREFGGGPMGDALSGAALRLFKWWRESPFGGSDPTPIIRFCGSHTQLIHLSGTNVLVLDVSFRNDVRQFCAWDSRSVISVDQVLSRAK